MKDNFSKQAAVYARYRPEYPLALFEYIISHVKERDAAWDCATGNGQSAKMLARYFKNVFATDISQPQLNAAHQAENIFYSLQPAEHTQFADQSFDLIMVSQALHWFDFDKFYAEVKRVGRPGSWIAVTVYGLLRINKEINELLDEYHFHTLDQYWDPERHYVDAQYKNVPFPFKEIETPPFSIVYQWAIADLEGYLNTWSALQKYIAIHQDSPVPALMQKIAPYWESEKMEVVFPLSLRMGQIN